MVDRLQIAAILGESPKSVLLGVVSAARILKLVLPEDYIAKMLSHTASAIRTCG